MMRLITEVLANVTINSRSIWTVNDSTHSELLTKRYGMILVPFQRLLFMIKAAI